MTMNTLFGFKVIVTPDFPKMTLGPGDYVTPEYRKEIDAWLLSFFGTINVVDDGKSIVSIVGNLISMNPRTYAGFVQESAVLIKGDNNGNF